jgi:REP element-mobilizing transposase RayT
MKFPLAFLITWTTYGTWLHGDERGSFDHHGNYIPPDPRRYEAAAAMLVEGPVYLTPEQRAVVDALLVEACARRGWVLHARNVRTNHVHVVVSAPVDGEQVRAKLKALAAARLTEHAGLQPSPGKDGARKWWTEKGNIEEIWDDRGLESANRYVTELQ